MRGMKGARVVAAGSLLAVLGVAGCAPAMLRPSEGPRVLLHSIDAPAEEVWTRLADSVRRMGLTIVDLRPGERTLQLGWLTPPGDGASYVRCGTAARVGSATLQPTIVVRETGQGSMVAVFTRARATAAAACGSNGAYEARLLEELQQLPADLAVREVADP
jgi:hypothetical protein